MGAGMSGTLTSGRCGRWVAGLVAALATVLALTGTATAALQPLQQVGSAGTGAGQLDGPNALAIGADGSLYIGDAGNDRISKFNPTGSFVKAWGWDVRPSGGTGFETCTTATGCKAGVAGGGAGQLTDPSGIAIDFAGNLHVSEFFNHRISDFTPEGSFIRARGLDVVPGGPSVVETCTIATTCKSGVSAGGAGALSTPEDLVFDGAGNLWLVDSGNNRIDQFDPSGTFVKAFGWDVVPANGIVGPEVCTAVSTCQKATPGDAAGQLLSPRGVALKGGLVYVSDEQNTRMSTWTTAGTFVNMWGRNVRPGGTAGFETCTIATTCQPGAEPTNGAPGETAFPEGIGFDTAGRLNVTEFENNRVSQFTTAPGFVRAFGFNVVPGGATGFETCTAATGCRPGTEGAGFGQLTNPVEVVSDGAGALWVADKGGDRILEYGEVETPPPPTPGPPSNQFSFGKVKKNKRKGTAKLTVEIVEGPGDLELAKTKKVKADDEVAEAEGETAEKLAIKPKGKAKKKLNKKGKAKVKAEVTYTPTGGEPNTRSKRIRLKMRS
jgi:hypothetical protein